MDRVGIGYALVDVCSADDASSTIIARAKAGGRPAYVVTANAQHIVLLERDKQLRQIYDHADLVVSDGVSLLLAARLYGRILPGRITGVDIFQRLSGLAAENGLRVFLLGGRANSAELAAAALQRRFPGLQIGTYCPPLAFEKTAQGLADAAAAVRSARPHLLFVALGAPKQEYWIYQHGLKLSVPVSIGVGGSFEMVAGVVRRAPRWTQSCGLEWLHRLCLEPRRMWRRYLIGNCQFMAIVTRQQLRRVFLNMLFSLVDGERFAAELLEPGLNYHRKRVAEVMNSAPGDIYGKRTVPSLVDQKL
jgi:N-acetylglucosaminyldiphosphoundecaprenol N-acetyl-beta-D-mannosaminyltransferase